MLLVSDLVGNWFNCSILHVLKSLYESTILFWLIFCLWIGFSISSSDTWIGENFHWALSKFGAYYCGFCGLQCEAMLILLHVLRSVFISGTGLQLQTRLFVMQPGTWCVAELNWYSRWVLSYSQISTST